MKREILMSIQPQWLEKILNREKLIEIRKTMPKCELPIDVYLYCTKTKPFLYGYYGESDDAEGFGYATSYCPTEDINVLDRTENLNGKVVAKFTLNTLKKVYCERLNNGVGYDYYYEFEYGTSILDWLDYINCSENELYNYLGYKDRPENVGYAWYIDNLVIFDKPKELSEFVNSRALSYDDWLYGIYNGHKGSRNNYNSYLNIFRLKKPPQSWQYVEVKE